MNNTKHLEHSFKTRHILMIALGSAIGTGLFFGSAASIKLAGPSILLAYLVGGLMMYVVVRALGEMAVFEPNVGSFSFYAYKYWGNYAGFIAGWNYWFNYVIVAMIELSVSGIFLDYWFPHFPHYLTALILLIGFGGINLLQVRFFGEFEFWFTGIKVVTIMALIAFGVYLIFFDITIKQNSVSNISNLWQYGGFFANGISGFIFSLVIVVFSFGGTELIGITAADAKNPQKIVPLAINGIILRIIIFYLATLAIIMCLYPWQKISGSISPFVDVFNKIGIPKAASLINLVAITAALSSFNSCIYGTSRMLYNLGLQKNAFAATTKLSNNGIPINATYISLVVIFIAVILNYLYPQQVFGVLLAIASAAAIINWIVILITHMKFKQHIHKHNLTSNYRQLFYPLSSVIAISFFVVVILAMAHMQDMHFAIYIMPLWLILLSVAYLIKQLRIKRR
jgi:L-asparagine transporter-like permease